MHTDYSRGGGRITIIALHAFITFDSVISADGGMLCVDKGLSTVDEGDEKGKKAEDSDKGSKLSDEPLDE